MYNVSVSASQVLELQLCADTPAYKVFFLSLYNAQDICQGQAKPVLYQSATQQFLQQNCQNILALEFVCNELCSTTYHLPTMILPAFINLF